MSAHSERTLAVLRVMDKHIVTANEHSCGCGLDPGLIHVADEILAALNGACMIRTVEQLDALPPDSTVMSLVAIVAYQRARTPHSDWYSTGLSTIKSIDIPLPALLIWPPRWADNG